MQDISPDSSVLDIIWPNSFTETTDDFLVYLRAPFMKHYEGTVFRLGSPQGFSGWDDDIRLREKLHFSDQRTYLLPDAGRGLPAELAKSMTKALPFATWSSLPVFQGPWRITSMIHVSNENIRSFDVLPRGLPPVVWKENQADVLCIDLRENTEKVALTIFERLSSTLCWQGELFSKEIYELGHVWPPGFYQMKLSLPSGVYYEATVIKLFPMYVSSDKNQKFTFSPTIW